MLPQAWNILQGRVYALTSDSLTSNVSGPAGNGFGLHLVNVSESKTTGGKSTAEVEQYFSDKLGDMSKFDSFMDYNAMFYTTGLAAYKSTFQADGVNMYETTWEYDSKTWTSIFIHVPNTQMVIELCQVPKNRGLVTVDARLFLSLLSLRSSTASLFLRPHRTPSLKGSPTTTLPRVPRRVRLLPRVVKGGWAVLHGSAVCVEGDKGGVPRMGTQLEEWEACGRVGDVGEVRG